MLLLSEVGDCLKISSVGFRYSGQSLHFSSVLNTRPFLMLLFMASVLLLAAGRGRVVPCDHVTTVLSPVRWGQQPALLTSYSRRSGMCLWLLWLQETAWLQLCAAAFFQHSIDRPWNSDTCGNFVYFWRRELRFKLHKNIDGSQCLRLTFNK